MGNSLACFSSRRNTVMMTGHAPDPCPHSPSSPSPSTINRRNSIFSHSPSKKKKKKKRDQEEDAVIREQALTAIMLLKQYQRNNSSNRNRPPAQAPFGRSVSVVYPSSGKNDDDAKPNLARSSTSTASRHRSQSIDYSSFPLQHHTPAKNQDVEIDGAECQHFVLVHGGGFGAWCWYKIMTLLSEAGFCVDTVDLTASGIHSSGSNCVQSMAEYTKPLTDLLRNLEDTVKVILVGHDFGGACVSYVMELFPSKIARAVFVSAPMMKDGQSILDVFSHEDGPSDLMRQAQTFLYENGKDQPPTAIDLDKALLKDLLFNQSPAKDVALASVSMRPIPFAPLLEKLSLSEANHGSVRRFYIETQEDRAIPVSFQEFMVNSNPPEKVFHLKGSDHAPFLSKPQALHRLLVEISKIPAKLE